MSAPTDTSTEMVVPEEFAEFVPDDLQTSTEAVEVWVARAREQAEAVEINSAEDAEKALALSKTYAREIKRFEEERKALTKPRKDAAEFIKAQFDGAQAPFKEAGDVLRGKLSAWQTEQEEKAREEQRRREEERQRIEAEARAEREAAEREEREAAELAAEAESPDDEAAAAELAAEARRDAERAQVVEQAIASVPAEAPATGPKLSGFSQPKRWQFEVVDFDALPNTLPDGTPLKVVDEVALRRWMLDQVKTNGDQAPELPGAKFEKVAAGSRVRT